MVWGGIIVHGDLNTQGFINQILVSEAVPFIQKQQHHVTRTIHSNNSYSEMTLMCFHGQQIARIKIQ